MSKARIYNDQTEDFSLVLGGPLYQLYRRFFLLKPPLDFWRRRIIFIALITWLPLLVLSMIGGVALRGVGLPFLYDIETHARFLGSLTLLVASDLVVHKRIRFVVSQFMDRGIIESENIIKFKNIISSALRLRNSIVVETLLVVFVFSAGRLIWKEYTALNVATWYATPVDGKLQFSLAGYWYVFVSLPIFQFIFLRWYFRLFVWYRFLWQVSRLKLHLNALHPDRVAGLGFLEKSVYAFGLLLIAHTVLLSGGIANRIFYASVILPHFYLEIFSVLIFLVLLVLTPLFFFIGQLFETKQMGIRDYGIVASQYVDLFKDKWINKDSENDQNILGTSDIQSLADLSNSFAVSSEMRIFPFTRRTVIQILFISAFPIVPLVLTMIPIEQMINHVVKIFF